MWPLSNQGFVRGIQIWPRAVYKGGSARVRDVRTARSYRCMKATCTAAVRPKEFERRRAWIPNTIGLARSTSPTLGRYWNESVAVLGRHGGTV
jgi:hypothetical protein